ncbi:hypothetical protein [Pseudomonas sp. 6D_7.1_Bac1]|uniref:hypothetical protein n=1 Tax=Pseudomonas sp. 6D_7.1_Bac1 TaxID=2971615 RepID=UPI0021C72438|nr:hypothetical protein [Pseudomonas sp. 6D_7.1_Bac1]MCU1751971.1 hypothetical protein [Pseudomonas sp. 6D_7.1_Bac1]
MPNDTLAQAVDTLSAINKVTNAGTVHVANATSVDAALVGWTRAPMASLNMGTVAASLGTTWISVWEFVNLITNKPSPSDPTTWDWTPAIAGAQAEARSMAKAAYGGYGVSFTAGIYPVTRIIHYSGTPLQGMGSANTFLPALPFDPANGKPYGMLELAPGVVQGAHISGITFCGSPSYVYGTPAVNPNQWGFYCHAQYDASYVEGGFWHSNLIDVCFWNFKKGIWSRGGYTQANSKRPHQWINFSGVQVEVQDGGEPWLFTGQHGQISVRGGHGKSISSAVVKRALYSVKVAVDPDPSTTAYQGINGESTSDVSGVGNATRAGHNIIFSDGFSFQGSQKGLWVNGPARNITSDGCWYETLAQAVTMVGDGSISLSNNHFANAGIGTTAGGLPGTGYIVTLGAKGQIDWGPGNVVEGSYDHLVSNTSSGANECNGINWWGCLRTDATGPTVLPALPQKSPAMDASGNIDMGTHRFGTIAPNADRTVRLSHISSNLLPGQTLVLRATTGPVTIKSAAGSNMITGTGRDITIPVGGIATFLRIQPYVAGAEFLLQSVSAHTASAVPTDGFYYTQGHVIENIATAAGVPDRWKCTTSGLAGTTAVFKAAAVLT